MYVSIGPGAVVRRGDLVGVFDLDNATWSHRTRKSLAVCEREGRVIAVGDDLPRALLLCSERSRSGRRRKREHNSRAVVYLTQLSVQTLEKRVQSERILACSGGPGHCRALSPAGFGWLLAGGIIYTVGGIIYALKLPIFNSHHKNFGSHEIFHLFVRGGSVCHFIVMYFFVMPMPA